MQFNFLSPVSVIFGEGSINKLGSQVSKFGNKAMLVTTGQFFKESGLVDKVVSILSESGITVEYFCEVGSNPLTTQIDNGAEIAKKTGCQFIIGLGGGSAMDAAKGIAISATHEGGLWKYCGVGEGNDRVLTDMVLPIISITTTSGTGSHVTPWAVFTNPETNEKPGMGGPMLFPKVSFVDPELTASMPKSLTAATGFDVFAHALEAYTSRLATPMTDMYAVEAIKLVGKFLVRVVKDGNDIEARSGMALADTLAGVALSMAEVTLCHAMAHAVGGVANAHHGETLAIMTPQTLRFSINHCKNKFKDVGYLLNGDLGPNENINIALGLTMKAVKKLQEDIGLDKKLSDVGVSEKDLPEIAKNTLSVTAGSVSNDYKLATYDDVIELLRQSL